MPAFRSRCLTAPLLGLLLLACGEDEPGAARAAAPPPPAVVVAEIRSETVPVLRDFVARTEAVSTIEVVARVEAVLAAMEFEEGEEVAKDAVLYRLDESTYRANLALARAGLASAEADLKLAEEQVSVRAAEANLLQARARLKKTEQDVARLRPLAEKDAVPRQDLDTALAAEEVAQAEVQAAEATLENARIQEEVGVLLARARIAAAQAQVELSELDLAYCTITSPIDGLIGRTAVDVGNLVGRGAVETLATVSSIDPMYVTFAISEGEYLRLGPRTPEEEREKKQLPVHLILADDSTYPETGRIVTAERALAQETGTLQIVSAFPNPGGRLRPGQFGRVRIQVAERENAVLCPQRAVMEQQGAKIVMVLEEGDVVAVRTVQVLERHGDDWVVSAGLEAGERVIVEGQLKARPGMPVRPAEKPISSEPPRKPAQR